MLTRLRAQNFKRFDQVEVELGNTVVFIGPNNAGKTTALQALALWDVGVKRWLEKRGEGEAPAQRPGVTINRRDLIALPVPTAKYLWHDLHLREGYKDKGKNKTRNVLIEVEVEGVDEGELWRCGLEFDYANEESFYCRPLRRSDGDGRMAIPQQARAVDLAYLPPMSGLTANETRLDPGAIHVRLGEGRTAEVLRNLCYQVYEDPDETRWQRLAGRIRSLFGVELAAPVYVPERGEITMSYRDPRGVELDLSSVGRGLQQTLLLLAHLERNPRSVILIDEPDAHLEILRQRQIYQVLSETARESGSQVLIASHSEVLLNEAADRDILIAFVGRPHRIDDRGFQQAAKALKEIGFDQYYQAEQTGWVLYLEGSTDLAILRAFAELLEHEAREVLERPFVHYVGRHPKAVYSHFFGLREAKPDLQGFALFDRLKQKVDERQGDLRQHMWGQREIENYLCRREVLLRWASAAGEQLGPEFTSQWEEAMETSIEQVSQALKVLGESPWSEDVKASDRFLVPLFRDFYEERLKLPNLMQKTDFHQLARFVEPEELDPEVRRVLDGIVATAERARPVGE